jgi:hypothetical protein
MFPCPHCQQPTIPASQKLLWSWVRPLACSACGRLAYLPLRNIIIALLVWTTLSWIFISTALFMGSVLYLFGSIPALWFAIDKWVLQAPLHKLD